MRITEILTEDSICNSIREMLTAFIDESASAGATSSSSIACIANPQLSPGKARGKKSFTGSMTTGSGTKTPPQPKVVQPKTSTGVAVNALDITGSKGNLFGSPIKR